MEREIFRSILKPNTRRALLGVLLATLLVSVPLRALADLDIDLNPLNPTPSVTSAVTLTHPNPSPTATAVPAEASKPAVEATPSVLSAHGSLKMRHFYEAGIKYYRQQDYEKAVRYLERSLTVQDPYTPKFYYAEANAMLGVIHQFYIIRLGTAYRYYRAALDVDPHNVTARKHIKEVYPYRYKRN